MSFHTVTYATGGVAERALILFSCW